MSGDGGCLCAGGLISLTNACVHLRIRTCILLMKMQTLYPWITLPPYIYIYFNHFCISVRLVYVSSLYFYNWQLEEHSVLLYDVA